MSVLDVCQSVCVMLCYGIQSLRSFKHGTVDESCCIEFRKLFVMIDVMIFKPGRVLERTSLSLHLQTGHLSARLI